MELMSSLYSMSVGLGFSVKDRPSCSLTPLTEKPYPTKMVMVSASNMVLTWLNSKKVKEAL